ncbi:MAG: glycoside hydrolase family 30 protein [Bacteroidales bacterium]|nr:MAG: glycoside hydrolase family 30 protein [Bacteroidales bacterium]
MKKQYFLKRLITWLLIIPFFIQYSCESKISIGTDTISFELKNAEIYLTAKGTDHRLTKLEQQEFSELVQPDESFPTIIIDPCKSFQTIVGFGGALTDASAETFYQLPGDKQSEILKAYFDAENGIGYTFCRVPIHSCDFSSESYAYTEVPDDTLLEHFSIEHDRKYKLPFIKKALEKAGNNMKIFASPWSPPAWMKTNNNMLYGGKLKPEYFQAWADYYVRFIDEYSDEDIPIWGLTVQNEPMAVQRWESCIYTAEEEKDFVKNYLGPTLNESEYPETKLIIWDHNRGIMYQRAKEIYDDPEASKYVWGTGFHWYVGDHFENVKLHYEAFPDKKLIFTEGCTYPFNIDSIYKWHWGERYGESVLHDLNNGASGWVDWNVLLNEQGGPNHVSNFCFAPVIGNTKTGEVHYMSSFYYMGHFSKFIRPGARRIICSSNYDDLLATAFLNTDNTIAVVVLNMKNKDINFKTWINKKFFETNSPAHSIMTILID